MVRLEHVVFTHELLSALFRVHILITAREAVVVFVALCCLRVVVVFVVVVVVFLLKFWIMRCCV